MSLKLKIYSKIYKWVKARYKNEHLSIYHNDIKCANCNEWFSISGIEYLHRQSPIEFGVVATCGKCGHSSYWNLASFPFPVSSDNQGMPLEL